VRGNSIVEHAADAVDVFGDRDRPQDFVRGDSRLRRHDISCRWAVFGVGAAGHPGGRSGVVERHSVHW
jgi:hypothetical protein